MGDVHSERGGGEGDGMPAVKMNSRMNDMFFASPCCVSLIFAAAGENFKTTGIICVRLECSFSVIFLFFLLCREILQWRLSVIRGKYCHDLLLCILFCRVSLCTCKAAFCFVMIIY